MINHIHIKNFKSLKDVSMEMSNLNLLTGINGVGKSSLIEALLLLRQSYNPKENEITQLDLNNYEDGVQMGVQKEILCESADEDVIEMSFIYNDGIEHYVFDCPKDERQETFIAKKSIQNKSRGGFTPTLYELQHFRYLSAERISPQDAYRASQGEVTYKNLGKHGQFSIEYIDKYAARFQCKIPGFNLVKEFNLEEQVEKASPLISQINAWMSFISPNVKIKTQYDAPSKTYKLSYQYGKSEFTPKHVGFGITYTLPVVTAILISEPGDLVIIENPEAHLHPRAQSKLGELMAIAAQGGVQLIIETHSDHVLNGVSVATKQGKIDAEKVKIYYYAMNMQEMVADFYSVEMKQNGRLFSAALRENSIEGFFDQIDTDLEKILGF